MNKFGQNEFQRNNFKLQSQRNDETDQKMSYQSGESEQVEGLEVKHDPISESNVMQVIAASKTEYNQQCVIHNKSYHKYYDYVTTRRPQDDERKDLKMVKCWDCPCCRAMNS